MELYHGSNVPVEKPRLFKTDRRLDFGSGFYLTSDLEQAQRWARIVTKRRGEGEATVSVHEFDKSKKPGLKILEFGSADADWLDFIGANRRGEGKGEELDLVIGPVANDNTMPTLRLFFADIYTVDETIERLLPQNLKDQYAFKTQAALDTLSFVRKEEA